MHRPLISDGFEKAEKALERAKVAQERSPPDNAAVARESENAVIALSSALYVPEKHEPRTGPRPGTSPTKRLAAYVEAEFAGEKNVPKRRVMLSALENVDTLQQQGTADSQSAALCHHETERLVSVLKLVAAKDTTDYTIGQLIDRYLERNTPAGDKGYRMEAIRNTPIASLHVSKFTENELINYCKERMKEIRGVTVHHDLTCLRTVLRTAKEDWNLNVSLSAFDDARKWIQTHMSGRWKPRYRRVDRDALDAVMAQLEERESHARSKNKIRAVIEFGLATGWKNKQICSLTWEEYESGTYALTDEAKAIIEKRRGERTSTRIFPYREKSLSAAFTQAKDAAGIEKDSITFHDIRREAAIVLRRDHGKSLEEVSKLTRRVELNSLKKELEGTD